VVSLKKKVQVVRFDSNGSVRFSSRWFGYGSGTVNKLTVWFVNYYNGLVIFGSVRFGLRGSIQFMVLFAHPYLFDLIFGFDLFIIKL